MSSSIMPLLKQSSFLSNSNSNYSAPQSNLNIQTNLIPQIIKKLYQERTIKQHAILSEILLENIIQFCSQLQSQKYQKRDILNKNQLNYETKNKFNQEQQKVNLNKIYLQIKTLFLGDSYSIKSEEQQEKQQQPPLYINSVKKLPPGRNSFDNNQKISMKMIKMMSFYLQIIQGQKWILSKDFKNQTIIISGLNINGDNYQQQKLHILEKEKVQKIYLEANRYALVLNPEYYRSLQAFSFLNKQIIEDNQNNTLEKSQKNNNQKKDCQFYDSTTIQKQILFLAQSQYFSSMQKKRQYLMLRTSTVHYYSHGQNVFTQGQNFYLKDQHNYNYYYYDGTQNNHNYINNQLQQQNYVYLVREGQFVYQKFKPDQKKSVDLYICKEGHIFGSYQILENFQKNFTKNQKILMKNQKKYNKRQFTIKCKSSKGIIYKFTQDVFMNKIKPYCQAVVMNNHKKMLKILQIRNQNFEKNRSGSQKELLSQTFTRSFSNFDKVLLSGNHKKSSLGFIKNKLESINSNNENNNFPVLNLNRKSQSELIMMKTGNASGSFSFKTNKQSKQKIKQTVQNINSNQSLSPLLKIKKTVTMYQNTTKSSPHLQKNGLSLTSQNNSRFKNLQSNEPKDKVYSSSLFLKKKSFSDIKKKSQQQKNYADKPQFKEFEILLEKKQKLAKVKQIMGLDKTKTRGQVLFSLFKTTYQFQKSKKMRKNRSKQILY